MAWQVPKHAPSVALTPTAKTAGATVMVAQKMVAPGFASQTLPLAADPTETTDVEIDVVPPPHHGVDE